MLRIEEAIPNIANIIFITKLTIDLSRGNEPCYNVTIEDLPVSNFGLV